MIYPDHPIVPGGPAAGDFQVVTQDPKSEVALALRSGAIVALVPAGLAVTPISPALWRSAKMTMASTVVQSSDVVAVGVLFDAAQVQAYWDKQTLLEAKRTVTEAEALAWTTFEMAKGPKPPRMTKAKLRELCQFAVGDRAWDRIYKEAARVTGTGWSRSGPAKRH